MGKEKVSHSPVTGVSMSDSKPEPDSMSDSNLRHGLSEVSRDAPDPVEVAGASPRTVLGHPFWRSSHSADDSPALSPGESLTGEA